MAGLTFTRACAGWDQKTVALLGLALLVRLDAPGILVGPLASFGTACTLRTLASRPCHPRAMAWIAGICLLLGDDELDPQALASGAPDAPLPWGSCVHGHHPQALPSPLALPPRR